MWTSSSPNMWTSHWLQTTPNVDQLVTLQRICIYTYTIRNAWITILISLECFDVMHMKSLRKFIPPEFSDVMIT